MICSWWSITLNHLFMLNLMRSLTLKIYNFDMLAGHIVVLNGNTKLLIDTGAPSSFGEASSILFAGNKYTLLKNYMGITTESLSNSIGGPVDALIGSDILNEYDILIDPTNNSFMLTKDELPLTGTCIGLDNFMGIPIINAKIGNEIVRMFFDTGAKLSYLDSEKTHFYHPVGTEYDFYPGLGDFSTITYDIQIELAEEHIILRVGNLPDLLQTTLMMANTSGILGTAILKTHKITFAPRRKRISFNKIDITVSHTSTERMYRSSRVNKEEVQYDQSNILIDIIEKADRNDWCYGEFGACSTCGASDIKYEILKYTGKEIEQAFLTLDYSNNQLCQKYLPNLQKLYAILKGHYFPNWTCREHNHFDFDIKTFEQKLLTKFSNNMNVESIVDYIKNTSVAHDMYREARRNEYRNQYLYPEESMSDRRKRIKKQKQNDNLLRHSKYRKDLMAKLDKMSPYERFKYVVEDRKHTIKFFPSFYVRPVLYSGEGVSREDERVLRAKIAEVNNRKGPWTSVNQYLLGGLRY